MAVSTAGGGGGTSRALGCHGMMVAIALVP